MHFKIHVHIRLLNLILEGSKMEYLTRLWETAFHVTNSVLVITDDKKNLLKKNAVLYSNLFLQVMP